MHESLKNFIIFFKKKKKRRKHRVFWKNFQNLTANLNVIPLSETFGNLDILI
jgi:hypothetical protein